MISKGRNDMRTNLIAIAALALGAAAPATARDFVVEYKDLDLSSAKDQKTLERRIDSAARKYCAMDTIRTGSRTKAENSAQCYSDARTAAREQMSGLIAKAQMGG